MRSNDSAGLAGIAAAAARLPRALAGIACGLLAALPLAGVPSGTAEAASITRIESGNPRFITFLLEGQIASGDLRQMREAVAKVPPGSSIAVILDSPGGNLGEGLQLGAYFHDQGIATIVKGGGGSCYSACAIAFLGGRDGRTGAPMRVKLSDGKLGFHQFSRRNFDPLKIYTKADYDEQVAQAQEVTRDIVRYLKLIGEDLSKLQLMLRAPSEDMNVLSDDECLARGFKVLDEATGRLVEPGRLQRVASNR